MKVWRLIILNQIFAVESGSASNPDEFQEIHRKQQELEESLTKITSGKNGVEVQAQNMSQIFQQVSEFISSYYCARLINWFS